VFDLLELEDDVRTEVLQMSDSQLHDVARFCNAYPSLEVEHELLTKAPSVGDSISLSVSINRENNVSSVVAPFFPQRKEEGWWLVLGDPASNQLLTIKRVSIGSEYNAQLDFSLSSSGRHKLKLYLMSDSYIGADQEFEIDVDARGGRRN